MTFPIKKVAMLAPLVALAPAIAFAGISVGDTLGTEEAEIRQKLEAAGYTIEEVEREDGEIEVEASLDG